jgi:phosphatidylinositol glycan class Q protein
MLQNDISTTAAFIAFWGSLVQIVVDIIGGLCCSVVLFSFSSYVLQLINSGGYFLHVDVLATRVKWLMDQPGGMKLNVKLDKTLGTMVLYAIDRSSRLTFHLSRLEPKIIEALIFTGFLGLSMVLSLASDILSLTTIHLSFLNAIFSKFLRWEITNLGSLWNLFRGKKKNVLRRRIDSCDYDKDQLLVGTVIFTILLSLFPTVLVYFIFFSFVQLLIQCLQAGIDVCLTLLTKLPFFALMLRILNSSRLPGGVCFELLSLDSNFVDSKHAKNETYIYLELRNRSISMSSLLTEFFDSLYSCSKRFSFRQDFGLWSLSQLSLKIALDWNQQVRSSGRM